MPRCLRSLAGTTLSDANHQRSQAKKHMPKPSIDKKVPIRSRCEWRHVRLDRTRCTVAGCRSEAPLKRSILQIIRSAGESKARVASAGSSKQRVESIYEQKYCTNF